MPLKQLVTGSNPVEGTLLYKTKKIEYINILINLRRRKRFSYNSMALTTKEKTKVIKDVSENEKDTGSADVQIALLSKQIDKLVLHLKKHAQDVHSKRGLITMVIKRKKMLVYLKKISEKKYSAIIKKIGLKK